MQTTCSVAPVVTTEVCYSVIYMLPKRKDTLITGWAVSANDGWSDQLPDGLPPNTGPQFHCSLAVAHIEFFSSGQEACDGEAGHGLSQQLKCQPFHMSATVVVANMEYPGYMWISCGVK